MHSGAEKASSPVSILIQMQSTAVSFAQSLARALVGAPPADVVRVVRTVYAPYEGQIARCGPGVYATYEFL